MIDSKNYYRTLCLIFGFVLIVLGCFAFISLLVFIFFVGDESLVFSLGKLLFNTFGFSSFLIPLFFLIAAAMLFVPGWTMIRGGYLIYFLIPFFTIFGGEKLAGIYPPPGFVKLLTSKGIVILSFLLAVLEYALFYFIVNFLPEIRKSRCTVSDGEDIADDAGQELQPEAESPEDTGESPVFFEEELEPDSETGKDLEPEGNKKVVSEKKFRTMLSPLNKLKDLLGFETSTGVDNKAGTETENSGDYEFENEANAGDAPEVFFENQDLGEKEGATDEEPQNSCENTENLASDSLRESVPGKEFDGDVLSGGMNGSGIISSSGIENKTYGESLLPEENSLENDPVPLSRDEPVENLDYEEEGNFEAYGNGDGDFHAEENSVKKPFFSAEESDKPEILNFSGENHKNVDDTDLEDLNPDIGIEDPLEVRRRLEEYQSVLYGDKFAGQETGEDEDNFEDGDLDDDDLLESESYDDPDDLEEPDEVNSDGFIEPDDPVISGEPFSLQDEASGGSGNSESEKKHVAVQKRFSLKNYNLPATDLLTSYQDGEYWIIDDATRDSAVVLKNTLEEFKIQADVTGIRKGPVITMFEILPAPGVKLQKIVALQDNIALRLAASSVRIIAPIPGKHAVGIEVPNSKRSIVSFKELIDTEAPQFKKMEIPVVLGKDITGEAQYLDLATTPHLLIAGSTGAGKSVCVNSMILSILFKRSPLDVRLILIDPKIVELKLYNDIPHLLTPVITEPKKAFQALQYCLCEMERRYALLDGMGVRDIRSYNRRIKERNIATEKLPYIVVIIDEFADLMATTGKELESTVARLAAMSRAVGIHLVLATQRPSIDVITGLIKANIPSRIAFMVASKMDSRIIIDQVGAEKLLGKGDMLYASATESFPVRIQGAFVTDNEVEKVVDFVKQYGEPDYIDDEIFFDDEDPEGGPSLFSDGEDPLYDKALEIVMQAGKASASYIQRRLKIGYNRAARLVEEMEERGIVGPANGSKPREVIHRI